MRKLKKLPPTLREKEHYMVAEAEGINKERIEHAIIDYLGVLGFSKAIPKLIELKQNKAIISVNRKYVKDVKAAFIFSKISCIGVSGILKRAREKFMNR